MTRKIKLIKIINRVQNQMILSILILVINSPKRTRKIKKKIIQAINRSQIYLQMQAKIQDLQQLIKEKICLLRRLKEALNLD